jgi:hypothetical protein
MENISGVLVVSRPKSGWRDSLRKYSVEIDGSIRGKVANGGEFRIELPPGRHLVRARISWTGSPTVPVVISANREIRLLVEPSDGNPLMQLGPDSYLRISVVS